MKTTKLILGIIIAILIISTSCSKRTCPTYSNHNKKFTYNTVVPGKPECPVNR